jgi:methyl-accepting chemotaxis protein
MARSSDSNFIVALLKDKTFQAREIRRVIVLAMVYLTVTTVLFGVFYQQLLGKLIDGMAPLLFVSEDIAMANDALPSLSSALSDWVVAMLVINALITVSLAVYITRKLGHPILAIKRSLREIGNGNLDVRLRASDSSEFGEIAQELEAAMHAIRNHIDEAKQLVEQACDIQNDQDSLHAGNDDNKNLDMALSNCRSALDFFQTNWATEDSASTTSDDNDGRHVA